MAFFERLGLSPMAGAEEAAAPIQALKPETRLAGGMTLAELNRKLTENHEAHFQAAVEVAHLPKGTASGLET